jgi:hypothetical protein
MAGARASRTLSRARGLVRDGWRACAYRLVRVSECADAREAADRAVAREAVLIGGRKRGEVV